MHDFSLCTQVKQRLYRHRMQQMVWSSMSDVKTIVCSSDYFSQGVVASLRTFKVAWVFVQLPEGPGALHLRT